MEPVLKFLYLYQPQPIPPHQAIHFQPSHYISNGLLWLDKLHQ